MHWSSTAILLVWVGTQMAGSSIPNWEGTWRGSLVNFPLKPNATEVKVRMDIGPFPVKDQTCSMWRTTYFPVGQSEAVKDYRLCRGTGEDDLFIDEGNNLTLACRWLAGTLVSPFKVNDLLLVALTRLTGDSLEEEIYTINNPNSTQRIQSMKTRVIQRLSFQRVQ